MPETDHQPPAAERSDHYALALIGADRTGIVATVTGALAALGCNLEDVSTSLLRGHFAMVLELSAPAGADFAVIRRELLGCADSLGLHLELWPLTERDAHGWATHVLRGGRRGRGPGRSQALPARLCRPGRPPDRRAGPGGRRGLPAAPSVHGEQRPPGAGRPAAGRGHRRRAGSGGLPEHPLVHRGR